MLFVYLRTSDTCGALNRIRDGAPNASDTRNALESEHLRAETAQRLVRRNETIGRASRVDLPALCYAIHGRAFRARLISGRRR